MPSNATPGDMPTGAGPIGIAVPAAPPALRLVFTIRAELLPAIEQGLVDGRRRRFVPISGGSVAGPRLHGVVLPGGGDWQTIGADGLVEVFARYSLKTDDGTAVDVTNAGVRVATPEMTSRMALGEDFAPDAYYFRTTPRFAVGAEPHDWLRRTIFVARAMRRPDHAEIQVFAVE
jgi:hypothetical protein